MKVISNQIRTITIEGVEFTPNAKGTLVPENKVNDVKSNFFFKALLADGSFTIEQELETKTKSKGK